MWCNDIQKLIIQKWMNVTVVSIIHNGKEIIIQKWMNVAVVNIIYNWKELTHCTREATYVAHARVYKTFP